jgi:hypothetical protein
VEGFLTGDVLLFLYDPDLLWVLDDWVAGVPVEVFDDLLPLLRRAFGRFEGPERRQLGTHLRRVSSTGPLGPSSSRAGAGSPGGGAGSPGASGSPDLVGGLDPARADRVMPILRLLLEDPS